MNIEQTLQQMKAPHVLEATILTLPQLLKIDDPQEGIERVLALSELPESDRAELDSLIRQASEEDSDKAVDLMRAAMEAASGQKLISDDSMEQVLDAVGRKQLVITPDLYYLGLLLVAGYIAFATKGRSSTDEKIVMKEDKNGNKTITIEKKVVYLNPFSPLVKLIQLLTKGGESDSSQ